MVENEIDEKEFERRIDLVTIQYLESKKKLDEEDERILHMLKRRHKK